MERKLLPENKANRKRKQNWGREKLGFVFFLIFLKLMHNYKIVLVSSVQQSDSVILFKILFYYILLQYMSVVPCAIQ